MPPLQASPVALVSNLRALPGAAPHWDHDPAAEQAVLGAVLLEEHGATQVWDRVSAIVSATDFHVPANGLVFEAMARLSERLAPIDVITICAELRAMGRLNTAGGAQYVGTLSDCVSGTAQCESHARIVLDHSVRRKVAELARGLGIRAQDLSRPISTTLAGALVALGSVPLPGVQAPTMSGDVERYFDTLEGKVPPASLPVPTGVADLDMALRGGLRRGSFLLVGQPGTGKTTLAMQMAASVASTHGPVLVISKELTRDELNDIFLANLGRLPLAKVIDAREHPDKSPFTDGELERLRCAANKLHSLPIHVLDSSTQGCPKTVMEIVAIARGMNPRPVFIVIDNLGVTGRAG
jgi:replicative DNA helicase